MEKNVIFKAIVEFVQDLHTEYGVRHKSIALYHRLLERTGVNDVDPITKHIDCFRRFLVANQDALATADHRLLEEPQIVYTPNKVFIDLRALFTEADQATTNTMWKHLLVIWSLIDPTSDAKKHLSSLTDQEAASSAAAGPASSFINDFCNDGSNESKFLADIVSKVENSIGNIDTANPLQTVTTLFQNGIFTDLLSGLQSGIQTGSLDPGRMIQSITGITKKASAQTPGGIPPELGNLMSSLMGSGASASSAPSASAPSVGPPLALESKSKRKGKRDDKKD